MATVTQAVREELFNDAVPLPTYVNARVLAANTAETITAPADANFVVFSGNATLGDYYVNTVTTATVPVADVTNGSASWLNPGYAWCTPNASISVISPNAGILCAAFYRRHK